MSAYSNDSWLSLKHRTKPSCVYSFACGERDSDWDFADTPSRGYSFASEDTPIQLLNNSGGMDEDEIVVRDVWYPHQAQEPAPIAVQDSGMSDDQSSGYDMDMDMDQPMQQVEHQLQLQQQQQQQFQQLAQQPVNTFAPTINKRKRGAEALEMNSGMATYNYQQIAFDSTKRVRVGA
jgi:hypothetical protein